MNTSLSRFSIVVFGIFLGINQTHAKANCPAPVLGAVEKAYPESKVSSCKQEKEKGTVQYEVKLHTKSAQKLELDVSPSGSILQVEENIALDSLPKSAISAFEAKYPKVKANRAEKQTKADGSVTYEFAFKDKGKKHEATFSEDGKFIEEE